jgi:hypothetical protein
MVLGHFIEISQREWPAGKDPLARLFLNDLWDSINMLD